MSLWQMYVMLSILILTLATEKIKLAIILHQSHAIYGTNGWFNCLVQKCEKYGYPSPK